ncbi:MAG: aminotransferase class I/II-fold pyridoxal phosphate-dependent enzyme [bacterium]
MPKKLTTEFALIERLPPYPLTEVVAQMTQLRIKGHDVINLGMGNPDMPSADFVVDKLCEAAKKNKNHRYSVSRGIPKLRMAVCELYERRYGVKLNFDDEVVVTMGAKEGLSHLIMAITQPGDVVLAPNPTYPIHYFAPVIARANVRDIRCDDMDFYFRNIERAIKTVHPRPKVLICSFPSNPTGFCVEKPFFKDLIKFAKKYGVYIVHDLAYADLCFDGYEAPSILQIDGAKKYAVELYSMSKGYNMPGWRVAFALGNPRMIHALKKIKSYLDYGMFQPIQIAATVALNNGDRFVNENCLVYQNRRDVFVDGMNKIGWQIDKPKATMFVWAKIPDKFVKQGSLKFSKLMLKEAHVCCAPGIGFGEYGDEFVRFALVENEKRIRQAVRGIKSWLKISSK